MATLNYMSGRKKYGRPQAMLWSENSGTLVSSPENPDYKIYVPNGYEINADTGSDTDTSTFNQFIILSDDNRSPIDISPIRIETKKRMVNGRMRSHHIADKLSISVSWDMLPSRSFFTNPEFNSQGQPLYSANNQKFTTDGGAGGVDLLDWYENHKGSFWVYLAYDKHSVFKNSEEPYGHLPQYNQLIEMFFSDFKYTVIKRGPDYDFWNISLTLEEV